MEAVLSKISDQPVAAASLGQVSLPFCSYRMSVQHSIGNHLHGRSGTQLMRLAPVFAPACFTFLIASCSAKQRTAPSVCVFKWTSTLRQRF